MKNVLKQNIYRCRAEELVQKVQIQYYKTLHEPEIILGAVGPSV